MYRARPPGLTAHCLPIIYAVEIILPIQLVPGAHVHIKRLLTSFDLGNQLFVRRANPQGIVESHRHLAGGQLVHRLQDRQSDVVVGPAKQLNLRQCQVTEERPRDEVRQRMSICPVSSSLAMCTPVGFQPSDRGRNGRQKQWPRVIPQQKVNLLAWEIQGLGDVAGKILGARRVLEQLAELEPQMPKSDGG